VDIEFASNHLLGASVSFSEASRLFGVSLGRKYLQRLGLLRAADKFSQLYGLRALRLHALKGNRAGQYSVTLNENYRLIIEKVQEDKVRIIDVEDYHGN
jgi:proteic killer suppression protein